MEEGEDNVSKSIMVKTEPETETQRTINQILIHLSFICLC